MDWKATWKWPAVIVGGTLLLSAALVQCQPAYAAQQDNSADSHSHKDGAGTFTYKEPAGSGEAVSFWGEGDGATKNGQVVSDNRLNSKERKRRNKKGWKNDDGRLQDDRPRGDCTGGNGYNSGC